MRAKRFVILWPARGQVRLAAEVIEGELFSIESGGSPGEGPTDATAAAAALSSWDGVSVPVGWRLGSRSERRYFADLLDMVREFASSGPGAPGASHVMH